MYFNRLPQKGEAVFFRRERTDIVSKSFIKINCPQLKRVLLHTQSYVYKATLKNCREFYYTTRFVLFYSSGFTFVQCELFRVAGVSQTDCVVAV